MAIATDKTFVSIVMLAAVMSIYMKNVRSPLDRVLHSRGIRVPQPFFSIWTVLSCPGGEICWPTHLPRLKPGAGRLSRLPA